MSSRTDLDALIALEEELSLEWQCAQPGLRAGADNAIDAVITLHAPRVLRGLGQEASLSARPGDPAVNGLRDVSLSLSVQRGIEVQPLSDLALESYTWRLPDLAWTQSIRIALRLHIAAAHAQTVNAMVPFARAKLIATAVHCDGADQSTVRLELPMGAAVLSDEEFDAYPPDAEAQRHVERLRQRKPTPEPAEKTRVH